MPFTIPENNLTSLKVTLGNLSVSDSE